MISVIPIEKLYSYPQSIQPGEKWFPESDLLVYPGIQIYINPITEK